MVGEVVHDGDRGIFLQLNVLSPSTFDASVRTFGIVFVDRRLPRFLVGDCFVHMFASN
jgi:hypothetical protein